MSDPDKHLETHSSEQKPSIVRVCGRYRVGKLLGCGTFGEPFNEGRQLYSTLLGNVYLAWDIKTGQDVALKLEPIESQHSQLSHEHSVYKVLHDTAGIPSMHWYGREAQYNVLILDRLGLTVEEAILNCRRSDISQLFSYADQMVFLSMFYNPGHLAYICFPQLSCLESLHSRNYIHRDVKPANFMTGIGEQSDQVFLIDFGLAQHFRNPSTRRHVLPKFGLKTVGTVAFTSINSHSGQMQTRCDDLESLVYSIVYLCRGSLPWQDVIKEGRVEQYEATCYEHLGTYVRLGRLRVDGLRRTCKQRRNAMK